MLRYKEAEMNPLLFLILFRWMTQQSVTYFDTFRMELFLDRMKMISDILVIGQSLLLIYYNSYTVT